MGRNCSFPPVRGSVVQQPPIPPTMPAIRSCRSERSLTPHALGVSGAAPLPAFLIVYIRAEARGKEPAHPRQLDAERDRMRPMKPENSHLFSHEGATESRRSRGFRWKRVKCPSPFHFTGYLTLHFIRTQELLLPEIKALRVAQKTGWYAEKTVDEAGATRLVAARCVTSADGSLPPHQFSECTNRLSSLPRRSAFLLALLLAGMVTCARRTRVTVAVTNAGTSDARKTPRDTEVMNRIGRGENPGMGWSDPVFGQNACGQKTTRVAPAHHALRVNVLSPRPRVGQIKTACAL